MTEHPQADRIDDIYALCVRLDEHSRKMLEAHTETRSRVVSLERQLSRLTKTVSAVLAAIFSAVSALFVKG